MDRRIEYKKMTVSEIQEQLFDVLCEIDKICKQHDIQYFLGFGSLLGVVRDGGFIPWDDDMDIFMMKKDWNKFNRIVMEELNQDKYFVINRYTRKDCPFWARLSRIGVNRTYRKMDYYKDSSAAQSGIFADIFPLEDSPANQKLLESQQFLLGIVDGILQIKSYKWDQIGKKNIVSCVLYILGGWCVSIENWNVIRTYIQEMYHKRPCNYVMVPMGPTGKYDISRVLYKKAFFSSSIQKDFQVMKGEAVIRQAKFPIPVGYRDILRKTYKNWRKRPNGKKPKELSYWVLEGTGKQRK